MKRNSILLLVSLLFVSFKTFSQDAYIYTKDGHPLLKRRDAISDCIKAKHKDKFDSTAISICECETDKIDRRFTLKQFKKYTSNNVISINRMIKDDSVFQKDILECYLRTENVQLLLAELYEKDFVSDCINSFLEIKEKTVDLERITSYCECKLKMVTSMKLSDKQLDALGNPNSVLYFEMIHQCGDPFADSISYSKNWNSNNEKDIKGPISDTIQILSINGMTYLKLKVGSTKQYWLFDTGSTDLLINKSMEEDLKVENVLTKENYLGIGEYEMANGIVDSCRRYLINNVQIGGFSINNVIIAVTDKGKRVVVGKTLLNKFSNWILNNQTSVLILNK